MTGHRRSVHNVGTFAVLNHRRQEDLAAVDHSPQVDVNHPPPHVEVIGLGDQATAPDTSVVAQYVHVAELFLK